MIYAGELIRLTWSTLIVQLNVPSQSTSTKPKASEISRRRAKRVDNDLIPWREDIFLNQRNVLETANPDVDTKNVLEWRCYLSNKYIHVIPLPQNLSAQKRLVVTVACESGYGDR
ncbi:hypothetical protein BC936DRAFT_144685 [Jimgerdemannia flammicorona]|uniref:Uncharacterized protein n=1 Tax=Jimgerdemannia flammicorona TaxID=994334 RepID=A0A433DBZ6_9FUNG|nr:hypothetical protein BC936DRAFT_144685 [Jimgerdemannia flammicorona]